ncbi:MAG: LysR family transcriptional regulator [Geminicoccales bacterium]
MRLEWIEDILAVHDTGSLRAAAEIRFLTASAFTRRIKTIETALGVELFDRSRKPVMLKPHVLELATEMRDAVATLRNIKRGLSDAGNDRERRVTIISQHTLTVTWAPRLTRLIGTDNNLNVRIGSGTKSDCLLSLLKREAEMALVYEARDEPPSMDPSQGDRLVIGYEHFVPVARLDDNPALQQSLARRHIPLIRYPGINFLGEVQNRTLNRAAGDDLTFSTVAETGLGPAVVEFVKQGFGVGWLPRSIVADELAANSLAILSDMLGDFTLDIAILRSKGRSSETSERLWSLVESEMFSKPD